MSPKQRKRPRKPTKPGSPGRALATVPPAGCDCPGCSGEFDGPELLTELVAMAASLAECEDAVEAELAGAMLVAGLPLADAEAVPMFTEALIPQVESVSGPGAVAFLLVLRSVTVGIQPDVATAASAAAARLERAGVPTPRWADELAAPVQVSECVRLADPGGTVSFLAATFNRAGQGHAFLVTVDEEDCGAAEEIFGLDAVELPAVLDGIRESTRTEGTELRTEHLDPAGWRWFVEQAMDARADHDAQDGPDRAAPIDDDHPEDGPPYEVLATLVRLRLAALPAPVRPAGAKDRGHRDTDVVGLLSSFGTPAGLGGRSAFRASFGSRQRLALPPKRTKSAGPAPVYQVKVSLKGTKPPIWRRLLVPADVTLDRLHDILQAAFDWEDSHLHVFETPYGSFGRADQELGHQAGSRVSLEQVAPGIKDKITYVYDFGDDWTHEIVVEKILDRDAAGTYPRCSGGRRATPPEDCGGVWGYEALLEILADPEHPEHDTQVEWLGLADARQFDPAAFDVDAVNRALARR